VELLVGCQKSWRKSSDHIFLQEENEELNKNLESFSFGLEQHLSDNEEYNFIGYQESVYNMRSVRFYESFAESE